MRFAFVTLALVVVLAFFAANPSAIRAASNGVCTKPTIQCPPFVAEPYAEYNVGRVIALNVFSGVYEVQVLTAGTTLTINVAKDLYDRLDIGDAVIRDSDGLHLLHKGPELDRKNRP